ncbi:GNAT family N-acetyltransferase [Roseomonas sp. E05]|uniref:GNAT family N-acetyltransferase n=1 Tax=Roseomonas sp. E05 TaxID=3046310 RepID=UPI0024BA9566|nr:GNAT family N-acetyltransferase [Roseomonas sp. E05]MDJ0391436.1 GNAT family N-acetyltransferase [Roseomonas sp. E05]
MRPDIAFSTDSKGPEAEAVLRGLRRHRAAALAGRPGGTAAQPLCFFHRDRAGEVRAGLVAELALDWLFIDKFWVDEGLRGQGLGTALLAAAEAEARRHGAVGVHLYTSSFQAPDFYRGHGFREIGRLEGRPAGHDRFWFAKRF